MSHFKSLSGWQLYVKRHCNKYMFNNYLYANLIQELIKCYLYMKISCRDIIYGTTRNFNQRRNTRTLIINGYINILNNYEHNRGDETNLPKLDVQNI